MAAAPRRVSDALFRRDMLGPSFGHFASTYTGMLLIQKLFVEVVLPPFAATLEAYELAWGRAMFSFIGGSLVGLTGFWGASMLFSLPALLGVQQWKIQPNKSLDVKMLLKSLPLVMFNFAFSMPLAAFLLSTLLPDSAFNFRELPSSSVLARDVFIWLVANEVTFFYIHRLFHVNKKLYAAIHKLHHTWTAPCALVAIYCNPLEHLLANLFPLFLGPLLCGSHVATISCWFFTGLIHTTAVHSGYWICDDNGLHDEHHAKFNVNFGVLGVMDHWYGTYQLPAGAAGGAVTAGASGVAAAEKKES